MEIHIIKTELKEILPLRNLFLQENNFQIRYNACHERGWTDSFIVTADGAKIGYGSVKGKDNRSDRDAVFEFYIIPSFQNISSRAFGALLDVCGAEFIECQSNDLFLSSLLYQYAQSVQADTILFSAHSRSSLRLNDVIFRKRGDDDIIFEHHSEPVGNFVLELKKEIVATGGFLLHYNLPFADLFMEVREDQRRKGMGSILIQEIIRECYLAGRVPAARCDLHNTASKMTLLKGGLQIAGFMLSGKVIKKNPEA